MGGVLEWEKSKVKQSLIALKCFYLFLLKTKPKLSVSHLLTAVVTAEINLDREQIGEQRENEHMVFIWMA